MPQDDSSSTSTDDRLMRKQWSVEQWLEDGIKPSRQRGLSPSERQRLAHALRELRRERFAATRRD
jgi:hypothetical protein